MVSTAWLPLPNRRQARTRIASRSAPLSGWSALPSSWATGTPGVIGTLRRARNVSNTAARSSGVVGGNNARCSSARPWRFKSTGTRSGRLVIRNQITLPRRRVSPMNSASEANTRSETPESAPPVSREPSAASASSTTTATGPRASSSPRIRSRFASVCPCHMDRKFLSSITGTPMSRAKQRTKKLFPVPTGPQIR